MRQQTVQQLSLPANGGQVKSRPRDLRAGSSACLEVRLSVSWHRPSVESQVVLNMAHYNQTAGQLTPQLDNPTTIRPQMRRKSSAQNLLSSFKTAQQPGGGAGGGTPAPIATGLPYGGGATTPSATTPLPRDWDAQSVHADSIGAGVQSPAMQGTNVEYLRDLVQKRIITLTYIRNVHEGCAHCFHIGEELSG